MDVQRSSSSSSTKGLITNDESMYAFVMLICFFHDILPHIGGANAAFGRMGWTGRVKLIDRHWKRYSILVAWRDRRGDETCHALGPHVPNGQQLFKRELV